MAKIMQKPNEAKTLITIKLIHMQLKKAGVSPPRHPGTPTSLQKKSTLHRGASQPYLA
jgi:hypothetical protein